MLAYVVRALTVVLALALVWYGLMIVLLAVKVSPHTVNSLSAYRTLYDDAAGLTQNDFSTAVRFIAGIAGWSRSWFSSTWSRRSCPGRISPEVTSISRRMSVAWWSRPGRSSRWPSSLRTATPT